MLHNSVDDIADAVLVLIASNRWLERHITVRKGHLDVKDWSQHVLLVVGDADLLGKVRHRRVNRISDSLDDESIDVVDVALPLWALFVGTHIVCCVLHQLVNLFAFALNQVKSGHDRGVVKRLHILGGLSSVLSLEQGGLAPKVHGFNHFADVLFHLFDKLINLSHDCHSLVDEWIDVILVPLESVDTWLEGLVHLLDSLHHQRLLNRQQCCDDVVVHLNGEVKTSSPSPVGVDFLEKLLCALRHSVVLELQVLDFTEVSDKDGVEVHTDETFLSKLGFLTDEQVFVQLILGVFLDATSPLIKLVFNVLSSELLFKRLIELDHIFVFLTVLQRLRQALESLHWVSDTVEQAMGPANGTSNRRHVRRDWGVLVKFVNLGFAILESLVGDLQVSFVQLKKGDLFLFKLVLDNLSGEKTLKALKQLELSDKSVTIVEGLSENRGQTAL